MNIKKTKLLLTFALVFGLTACATQEQKMTEAGAVRLTGEQASMHVSGNTEAWSKGAGYYHADGNLEIVWEGVNSSGTYTVDENGEVCTHLNKTYCHFYMNDNGAVVMVSEGKNNGVRKILEGNQLSQY